MRFKFDWNTDAYAGLFRLFAFQFDDVLQG
jgi:hypothetical protein